jgi:hypothetical protein
MIDYPVMVPRSRYRGQNLKKLQEAEDFNRMASLLEAHINEEVRARRTTSFLFSRLAHELQLPVKKVGEILVWLGDGSCGFSVRLPAEQTASASQQRTEQQKMP